MNSRKYVGFLSLTESGQLEILEGLSDRNKERIGEWMDTVEVKEDFDGSPYIVSPFVGLPLYTSKDIAYSTNLLQDNIIMYMLCIYVIYFYIHYPKN